MQTKLPLPTLPDALIAAGYKTAPYRALWQAAIDRRFPAARAANGRWWYDPNDLAAIAKVMGLSKSHATYKQATVR